ncbi:MAG: hypothetical protein KGH53_00385 [Candidatus Micrarchaeota archaeon]|nr:hypothetical protein [Candidatus Micrarchaeota archaeon]
MSSRQANVSFTRNGMRFLADCVNHSRDPKEVAKSMEILQRHLPFVTVTTLEDYRDLRRLELANNPEVNVLLRRNKAYVSFENSSIAKLDNALDFVVRFASDNAEFIDGILSEVSHISKIVKGEEKYERPAMIYPLPHQRSQVRQILKEILRIAKSEGADPQVQELICIAKDKLMRTY